MNLIITTSHTTTVRLLFLLCAALVFQQGTACARYLAAEKLNFSAHPTDAEFFAARVLDEPLIPLDGEMQMNENEALAAALEAYANRAILDDCSSLNAFTESHPASRWTGPLLVHLGAEYYNYGYFSKALDAWERAWTLCQDVRAGPAKPEADRALGELARMYSKIGRMTELSRLLDSTADRDLAGPATQLIHAAHGALWMMQNRPGSCFRCGPLALERILLRNAPSKTADHAFDDYKSPTNGFMLTQIAELSRRLGMNYQMAFRSPGAAFIVPAVIHWKVDHFAAIVERQDDRFLVQDFTFRGSVWMTTNALDEEASGYYLVPPGPLPPGWRPVTPAEGQLVYGKGLVNGQDGNGTSGYDNSCGGNTCPKCPPCPMTTYSMHALLVSLTLQDTPVGFAAPFGPKIAFTATYNQLEANQPANFYYSNLGPKWDCTWLSYVTDNPTSPNADVSLYLDGGGTLPFSNFNPATQSYSLEAMSQTLLVRISPSSYEMRFPDGSRREFSQSDGSTGSTRRVFLTQVIDPAGNAVQLNYDSQLRITNIVNAIGQPMSLFYTNTAFPFAITAVADPFGRTAYFQYNTNGWLTQITDVLGLISQYTYASNQFISALTTPYGTTTFTTGPTNGGTYLTATDPEGGTELLEYSQSLPVPHSLPASEVPHGLSTFNLFMDARDSFFWDKRAYAEGAWDYSKAHIYHWLHLSPQGEDAARILESEKNSLESRVWYNYPGQYTNLGAPYYLDGAYTGASAEPTIVAKVLDDGTTQLSSFAYNPQGNVTNFTDPVGRSFACDYSTNNIDLLDIRMTRNGKNELVSSASYNPRHEPLTVTDAAGQTTTITYGSRGEVLTVVDAKNETVTYNYDTNGFLLSVQGPLPGTNDSTSFTYDAFNRMETITDTEGYTVAYSYDAIDRPTLKTYPDGSTEQFVYDRLDLVALKDRLGRWTTNAYNADRQLIQTRDPLGRITTYEWCKCGSLAGITDPMGRTTSWTYDVESRPISKQYADGSMETYLYENSSGRLASRIDPAGQQILAQYYSDNTLRSLTYLNATNPTPTVSFTYDPDYSRVLTMQDGVGTTVYSYNPITMPPKLGANMLQAVSGPLTNSTVNYQYDQLGRVVSRVINSVTQNMTYDVLGRATGVSNVLGLFQYSYLNATARLTQAAYPNGQTTLYSYYDNTGDQRLKQISNLKPNASLLSAFGYAYNAVGQITSWTNLWDTLPLRVWNLNYDAADQLVAAVATDGVHATGTNAYGYDSAGNRTTSVAAGTTNSFSYNPLNQIVSGAAGATNGITYEWDGAHRLTAINQGTRRSEFTYDGLARRTRIVEKETGVVVSNNCFLWCGDELCEELDATGTTAVKQFFPQGESIAGAGGTTNLFYTRDHLGSIREASDLTGAIQARYDYDPYGQQTVLADTLPPTFAYTGFFQHQPSGLYFATYRGYAPSLGRWLNRDPIAEAGGLNLYDYVNNNPVRNTDPHGELFWIPVIIVGALAAAAVYEGYQYFKGTAARVDKTIEANKQRADAILDIPNGDSSVDQQAAANKAGQEQIDNLKETGSEGNKFNKGIWTDKAIECFVPGAGH